MKSLVISQSFVDSVECLSKTNRKRVWSKIDGFAENESGNGFSLHALNRADCDDSFKSARINDDIRVILSHHGDKYILLYVDHHNDAYDWAEGKYLDKNNFGALYIKDNIRFLEAKEQYNMNKYMQSNYNRPGLLKEKEISQKDLEKLGIDSEIAEHIMDIKEIDSFIDFVMILTEELSEGLLDIIAGNKSITELYNELHDDQINSAASIADALNQKDSKRRFYLVEDQKEFEYIMKDKSDKWKLFLHPKQSIVVNKDFNGPALIEGGPGTGKTVVGLHRAVYLAKNKFNNNNRILFCTFSRKLSNYINQNLSELLKQKNAANIIDVMSVDSLIYRLINMYNLSNKKTDMRRLEQLMEETYMELDLDEKYNFYETEYHEVIQRNHIRTLAEYLKIDRTGRYQGISENQREKAWKFFESILQKKDKYNLIDFEDKAYLVYKALEDGVIAPCFDSIIVDEAQDLSPYKLKVLNALTKEKKNSLFLLSDKNQRIFKLQSWKSDTGIDIVGRAHYLTLNYRTTKQIRDFADKQFISSKPKDNYFREYKSIYNGPEPYINSFENTKEQYRYIVNLINNYLETGINGYEIAIISPIEREEISGILSYEEIDNSLLEHDTFPEEGVGVCVSSLQGCKGLEFKIVIIANYHDIDKYFLKDVKNEWYNKQKLKQIECLKYVACTRARDELIVTYVEE